MMRTFLLLACLACAGDARRARASSDKLHDDRLKEMTRLTLALLASDPEAAFSLSSPVARNLAQPAQRKGLAPVTMQEAATHPWGMSEITPDGKLAQRVEGKTRKTWKFNDLSKDRVQIAVSSEGRPVHADIQLWLGPDWTPCMMKAYSEDGKLRPIQTLVGTRNKPAMIEVRNNGEYEFPLTAASNYAKGDMLTLPQQIPASTEGERVDGQALTSFTIDPSAEQVEVVLKTDGRQLNARIELLNAPNNPKQTFETFTNNGELNSLVVCFQMVDPGTTIRVVNLAPVEFPLYVHLQQL